MCKNTISALLAAAVLSSTASFAVAESGARPSLTLDPSVILADEAASAPAAAAAPDTLLMSLGHKVGITQPLENAGISIYGWIESGYTYNHRHSRTTSPILPGPFNHEFGGSGNAAGGFSGSDRNHYMLNQVDLRIERQVKSDKWDVGGMVEVLYGTDAAGIHSNGLAYGNESFTGPGGDPNADDRYNPQYQFDIPQAYVDVNVPVGTGLKMRAGKMVTHLGTETIDPRGNLFYSHSYLFSAIPFTHTGIMAYYTLNDQWSVMGGVSRGWDQALEDNNDAIDGLGQVTWTPNKQWSVALNFITGPENNHDNSHYRTVVNPIISWQVTEQLKLNAELLYVYDGGRNGNADAGVTHAYGDAWGAAAYASYTINDYVTANLRVEKYHDYVNSFTVTNQAGSGIPTVNVYEITLGTNVHPFPKDPFGKNLSIRPEVRYDYSEDHIFQSGNSSFKDQLTFAADVIFTF